MTCKICGSNMSVQKMEHGMIFWCENTDSCGFLIDTSYEGGALCHVNGFTAVVPVSDSKLTMLAHLKCLWLMRRYNRAIYKTIKYCSMMKQ